MWLINRKITVLIRNFSCKDYVIICIYILASLWSSPCLVFWYIFKYISTFSYIFMDFQAHGTASFTMVIHDICWFIVKQEIIGCSTLRKMWWHSSLYFNPGKNGLEKMKIATCLLLPFNIKQGWLFASHETQISTEFLQHEATICPTCIWTMIS